MILSTFCREQGTYHSAALLVSLLAPTFTEKNVSPEFADYKPIGNKL